MEKFCFGEAYMPKWFISAISCGLIQLDDEKGCLVVETDLGQEYVEVGNYITYEDGKLGVISTF